MDRRSFLLCFPGTLVACSVKPEMTNVQSHAPFAVSLELAVLGGQMVLAKMAFRNVSGQPARLLKEFATTGDQEFGNWFRITANGNPVPFKGIMVKRPPPGPDDFLTLPPGETARGEFVLNYCYDLPVGSTVLVQFVAFNPSTPGQELLKLESNVAQIAGAPA